MQPAAPRFPVQPILLAVGFVLLVGIGMSTLWLARQSSEDASSVFRTVSVQEKLSTLLLNVRRAESGQRGYLLTGRQAYLSDYSSAAPTVETFLAELRALLGENPERGPILDQMAELVRAKMAELQRTIDLGNAGKRDEAIALVQTDEGLNSMAELRRLAQLVLADEQRILRVRSETTRQTNIRLLVVSLVGMALVVLIGAISVFLVQRASREREAARNELAERQCEPRRHCRSTHG